LLTLGIPAGTGLPDHYIKNIIGIVKAYSTRVGAGAFPTELNNTTGEMIRKRGHEFGTTTGRPRRCGWLDLVAVKYSAMVCGATSIAIMLFDVLAGFDELKICTAYEIDSERTDHFLPDSHLLEQVKPIYEAFPGFTDEITAVRTMNDLPDSARRYLGFIAEYLSLPIEIVSVGPDRGQVINVT